MNGVIELLDRAASLGATFAVEEPDTVNIRAPRPLPADLMAELRVAKPLLVMAIVAFERADRINAMLGADPLTAAINRVSWLILDCEDADVPEAAIGPLRVEKRRLGVMFEKGRKRLAA